MNKVYSDIVKAGLILPKKAKYTMADVNALIVNSLFRPRVTHTLSTREAIFIVKCSAVYHDTDYADSLIGYDADFYPVGHRT